MYHLKESNFEQNVGDEGNIRIEDSEYTMC